MIELVIMIILWIGICIFINEKEIGTKIMTSEKF
jgi:hypothetical protein